VARSPHPSCRPRRRRPPALALAAASSFSAPPPCPWPCAPLSRVCGCIVGVVYECVCGVRSRREMKSRSNSPEPRVVIDVMMMKGRTEVSLSCFRHSTPSKTHHPPYPLTGRTSARSSLGTMRGVRALIRRDACQHSHQHHHHRALASTTSTSTSASTSNSSTSSSSSSSPFSVLRHHHSTKAAAANVAAGGDGGGEGGSASGNQRQGTRTGVRPKGTCICVCLEQRREGIE